MIRTERTKAAASEEVRRRRDRARTPTSEIAAIDAQYAAEAPRGAEPRWWEDVAEGDEVGPMVKGPLTVTDMICWHVGHGHGPLRGQAAAARAARTASGSPGSSTATTSTSPTSCSGSTGIPSSPGAAGNPTTFDYGRMRETWLIHLCTDWMGDDAWLWKLDCEFRLFNYVGDTQWLRRHASIGKYLADGDRPAVDLELCGRRTSEARSRRRATPPSCCPAGSTARCACPTRPGGATRPPGRPRRHRRPASRGR